MYFSILLKKILLGLKIKKKINLCHMHFNLIYKRFCHGLKSMVCDDAITWWTVVWYWYLRFQCKLNVCCKMPHRILIWKERWTFQPSIEWIWKDMIGRIWTMFRVNSRAKATCTYITHFYLPGLRCNEIDKIACWEEHFLFLHQNIIQ